METQQTLQRDDGSEVKIVARELYGLGLRRSVGVDVFHRQASEQDWKLLSDRPTPGWRDMSVEKYIKQGRSEMLNFASPGEILKVVNALEVAPEVQDAQIDSPSSLESQQG